MRGTPADTSEGAQEARRRARREGRLLALERSLTPEQVSRYRRWEAACNRVGVRVSEETRFEFLIDLKEDVSG